MKLTRFVLCAACAMVPVGTFAGPLFDNLGDANVGNRTPFVFHQYQSFSTGVSSFLFDDVKLSLDGDGSALTSFSIGLYADSSTTPGALIQDLGTLLDNAIPSGAFTVVDYSFAGIALLANTRYWIGMSSANQSNVLWAIEDPLNNPGDIGVAGEYVSDSGVVSLSTSPATQEAFKMQVNGTNIVSGAPEPGTIALMLTGLLAMGLRLRLRRT